MKVVFIEDVPNIGEAGQIKDVADGFGKNFLIPKKLAVPAKMQDIKNIEARIKARARVAAKTEAEMNALHGELEGKEIVVKAKVGQQDRLYGSITSADIASELKNAFQTVVDKRKIELEEPIRHIGNYEIPIKLSKDIVTKINVKVVAEE